MFRKMRRINQELPMDECIRILKDGKRGVLSVMGDDGYPYGIPLNFSYDEEENTIYFHGAKQGHKIDAIKACDKVCFTTWVNDCKNDGDWAWYVKSVIIMGRAELVNSDTDTICDKVRNMGLKYYPNADDVEVEIKKDLARVQLIALHIEHMSGKRVHEK